MLRGCQCFPFLAIYIFLQYLYDQIFLLVCITATAGNKFRTTPTDDGCATICACRTLYPLKSLNWSKMAHASKTWFRSQWFSTNELRIIHTLKLKLTCCHLHKRVSELINFVSRRQYKDKHTRPYRILYVTMPSRVSNHKRRCSP